MSLSHSEWGLGVGQVCPAGHLGAGDGDGAPAPVGLCAVPRGPACPTRCRRRGWPGPAPQARAAPTRPGGVPSSPVSWPGRQGGAGSPGPSPTGVTRPLPAGGAGDRHPEAHRAPARPEAARRLRKQKIFVGIAGCAGWGGQGWGTRGRVRGGRQQRDRLSRAPSGGVAAASPDMGMGLPGGRSRGTSSPAPVFH